MKKTILLIILGILLVAAARPMAMAERGYSAIGGEYFLLIAPLLIDEIITTIKDSLGCFEEVGDE